MAARPSKSRRGPIETSKLELTRYGHAWTQTSGAGKTMQLKLRNTEPPRGQGGTSEAPVIDHSMQKSAASGCKNWPIIQHSCLTLRLGPPTLPPKLWCRSPGGHVNGGTHGKKYKNEHAEKWRLCPWTVVHRLVCGSTRKQVWREQQCCAVGHSRGFGVTNEAGVIS